MNKYLDKKLPVPEHVVLNATRQDLYNEWWNKAIVDETVWPYLSMGRWHDPAKLDSGDWDHVWVMDPSHTVVMRYSVVRKNGMDDASIAVWGLGGPGRSLKVGRLLTLLPHLARRYGATYLDCMVAASNTASIKIVEKVFGQPWGTEPDGAWNGLIGKYEDVHYYRTRVQ